MPSLERGDAPSGLSEDTLRCMLTTDLVQPDGGGINIQNDFCLACVTA